MIDEGVFMSECWMTCYDVMLLGGWMSEWMRWDEMCMGEMNGEMIMGMGWEMIWCGVNNNDDMGWIKWSEYKSEVIIYEVSYCDSFSEVKYIN